MSFPKKIKIELLKSFDTRYGENPHQKGAFYLNPEDKDPLSVQNFKKIQGKEISFNNLLDVTAAIEALSAIAYKKPVYPVGSRRDSCGACVMIKHGNPCGASYGKNAKEAFYRAWEKGDSLAAFGGIIGMNREIDRNLAKLMVKKFFEVLIIPKIEKEAIKIFSQKPNLIILVNPALKNPKLSRALDFKKIRGGFLIQEPDLKEITEKDFHPVRNNISNGVKIVTKVKPTKEQIKDLLFAWKICKVSKSNAIVLVKDETLISSGVGQQDRKRCCQLAVTKAGERAKNTVTASDGFFPFSDGPEILIKAGVKAIIQPGGSIRDKETIELCNKYKIPMAFTNIRCFKH